MARKNKPATANDRMTWRKSFKKYYMLYLLLIPGLLWYIVFKYLPMIGITIAFEKYSPFSGLEGIFTSKWVGLYWFRKFFKSIYAERLIRNSLMISLKKLAVCFPSAIILAILLNAIPGARFKKTVQMISYMPHFLSTVVVCSMLQLFFHPSQGVINIMIRNLGGTGQDFLTFLKERALLKTGFTPESWCVKAPEGYAWGGSGVECTVIDLARFARLVMNGGEWHGEQLLPADYVKAAVSRQIDNCQDGFPAHGHGCHGYGYQIWVTEDNTFSFLGLEVYSVQFTCLMRGVALLVIGLVLIKHWRLFTRDEDIAEIEQNGAIRREMAQNRQPIDVHYILRQVKGLFRKQA